MRTLYSQGPQQSPGKTRQRPEVDVLTEEEEEVNTPWRVVLFDDDEHTIEEVISQLRKALNCNASKAEKLTMQVHNKGKATVYEGDFEACFEVNGILKEIQLVTEIKG